MRGTVAYVDDFYFGAGPTSTSAQYQGGSEGPASPTGNTPAGGGGGLPQGGTTMAASTQGGNGPTSPRTALGVSTFLPWLKANPLWTIPIIIAVLILLKIVREGGKKSSDFSPLKADAYWFVMTVLAACAGIPLVKAIANKYAPQPVADYLTNA